MAYKPAHIFEGFKNFFASIYLPADTNVFVPYPISTDAITADEIEIATKKL